MNDLRTLNLLKSIYHKKDSRYFLSEISFMIKWTLGFFIFVWKYVQCEVQVINKMQSLHYEALGSIL